jgi:hypothetical protein
MSLDKYWTLKFRSKDHGVTCPRIGLRPWLPHPRPPRPARPARPDRRAATDVGRRIGGGTWVDALRMASAVPGALDFTRRRPSPMAPCHRSDAHDEASSNRHLLRLRALHRRRLPHQHARAAGSLRTSTLTKIRSVSMAFLRGQCSYSPCPRGVGGGDSTWGESLFSLTPLPGSPQALRRWRYDPRPEGLSQILLATSRDAHQLDAKTQQPSDRNACR